MFVIPTRDETLKAWNGTLCFSDDRIQKGVKSAEFIDVDGDIDMRRPIAIYMGCCSDATLVIGGIIDRSWHNKSS